MIDERIKTIAEHFGLDNQVDKLTEEASELITARIQMTTKDGQVDDNVLCAHFLSELADVDIVLEQVKYLLTDNQRLYFDCVRDEKLDRTMKRIGVDL